MEFEKYLSPATEDFSDRDFAGNAGMGYEFIKDCHSILDIGCGTGNTIRALRERGHYVEGVTFNLNESKTFEQRTPVSDKSPHPIVLADMHDLPYRDGESFDAVIMWDVLEHSIAPYIALKEVNRVLKMGGKFLCYLPDDSWTEWKNHFTIFTLRQMYHMCKITGFYIFRWYSIACRGVVYEIIKDIEGSMLVND